MKPSTCSFRDAMIRPSCGMLSTPTSPTPKGMTVIEIMGADTMEQCGWQPRLFSVARKVINALYFFPDPRDDIET
jgi:hypothetical protein